MNTLVLLVAASCTPASDPLPVMETRPYAAPGYTSAAAQDLSATPQESRPRFFARLRGLFSRKSHATDIQSADLSGYSQSAIGNSPAIAPVPMASPNISTGNTNPSNFGSQPAYAPASSPTMQRMPTGQPF